MNDFDENQMEKNHLSIKNATKVQIIHNENHCPVRNKTDHLRYKIKSRKAKAKTQGFFAIVIKINYLEQNEYS